MPTSAVRPAATASAAASVSGTRAWISSGAGIRSSAATFRFSSGCRVGVFASTVVRRMAAVRSGVAPADVEAEPARDLAAGLRHERCQLLLDPLGLEAIGGARERERRDDGARVVADRNGDRTDVLHVL